MATINLSFATNPDIEIELKSLSDQEKEEFEERAAIMEYDGGLDKKEAEIKALEVIKMRHLKMSA